MNVIKRIAQYEYDRCLKTINSCRESKNLLNDKYDMSDTLLYKSVIAHEKLYELKATFIKSLFNL